MACKLDNDYYIAKNDTLRCFVNRRIEAMPGIGPDAFSRQIWLLENFRMRLVSCVLWRSEAPWSVSPRCLVDDFLLIPSRPLLVGVEGEGERILMPGEIFLVPAGRRHWYGLASDVGVSEHLIVHMLTDSQLCVNPLKLLPSHFHPLESPDLNYGRFKWLASLHSRSQRAAVTAGASLLQDLLLELFGGADVHVPALCQDERIRRALELAEERCLDALAVSEMANAAGLGEVQFRKLFRKQTGQSPKRHLEELRMRKACELLRSGSSMRIRELARALGFKGEWHFCSSFKRFAGVTPSEFRRHSMESL